VGFDSGDDELQFIGSDPLAVIPAVLAALQQVVGALGGGLAAVFDLVSLGADMTADHAVDVGHFFEDTGTFLLEGG